MMHLVLLATLALTPRPASLDIVADCGATADDLTDDTAAIRDCLAQAPRELVIPIGTFLVDSTASNNPTALLVKFSDTLVRGYGDGSVVQLIRDVNGFSQTRVFVVAPETGSDVERVTLRDFTVDGGRALTCLEAKHTPGGSGDGKGQQQHGVLIGGGCTGGPDEEGCTDYARDVRIERINFQRLSGDSIYLYNNVENLTVKDQTVSGWCRGGVVMNAYESCDQHTDPAEWDKMELIRVAKGAIVSARPFTTGLPRRGMRNVTITGNTMISDPTALQSARGIDVEPNAFVCDMRVEKNQIDQVEIGGVRRLTFADNRVSTTGTQTGGSIALVAIQDGVIRGNASRSEDDSKPPLYLRVMDRLLIENNDVRTSKDIEGILVSNNGDNMNTDVVIRANTVAYTGPAPSGRVGIKAQGVEGRVDLVGNSVTGYRDATSLFGGADALVADNFWNVVGTGALIRSDAAAPMGNVTVRENRGHANLAYWVLGALSGEMRDCGGSTTGRRLPKVNALTPCSPAAALTQASIDDLEARVTALEAP